MIINSAGVSGSIYVAVEDLERRYGPLASHLRPRPARLHCGVAYLMALLNRDLPRTPDSFLADSFVEPRTGPLAGVDVVVDHRYAPGEWRLFDDEGGVMAEGVEPCDLVFDTDQGGTPDGG